MEHRGWLPVSQALEFRPFPQTRSRGPWPSETDPKCASCDFSESNMWWKCSWHDLRLCSGHLLLPLDDPDETGTCQGPPVGPVLQRVSGLLFPTARTGCRHYIHLADTETETQRG